jgi:hypothetical protein
MNEYKFPILRFVHAFCSKRTQKSKCGVLRRLPNLQHRIIVTRKNKLQFQLMYCVDLDSFNESQVNEWHDDVEQLSLAFRTHSARIKLLVIRSHRPVGSSHNKNISLLRLCGQMEQLSASAGLLCLFFPDWFRTANSLMGFFVLHLHWQEVNHPCVVCAHASEREKIFCSVFIFICLRTLTSVGVN